MQKALLLALIFGAFLFSLQINAQEIEPDPYVPTPLDCKSGETWLPSLQACGIVAPEQSCDIVSIRASYPLPAASYPTLESYHSAVLNLNNTTPPPNCSGLAVDGSRTQSVSKTVTSNLTTNCPSPLPPDGGIVTVIENVIYTTTYTRLKATRNMIGRDDKGNAIYSCDITPAPDQVSTESTTHPVDYIASEEIECPITHPNGPSSAAPPYDLNQWCYRIPTQECDTETGLCDEECEKDDFGNCIVPPEDCFLTGSGSEVCYADPNEKCDVESVNGEPVYSNCESGCGFVGENLDNFICADKPDLPSLDDCIITTNGYACPSDIPEPNDDITDPDKPNSDMKKRDFKDVLIGVETRQDATNKLLSEQIKRDQDNTNKLAGKLDIGNKALKGIEDNTGSAAKSLREGLYGDALEIDDGTGSLLSDLGLTGDESITDLEKGTVSLSDYRDQFTWSAGSSTCPAPRSMNILYKNFTIDWQPYCDAFTVIGYLIKAGALFLSGFIAFGVRK
ncbi:virulence factor TspB C-terminal domain-related protein [Rheinheimera sp. MMS21-TC3]|uniref:virulence factor TspB C-terminal domain-related protein n=1 Tax=Rheinheimera sp. MMS21-TC3 TaxID=3072790 RepID=UPI0028C4F5E7|nr:virulence factor TspB C-terminal domain-related protein [Rheinheimera sp. MMS21-TC3]WNO61090.1 virulence factor TspB C-terminal domain-related protein [Rheinheimera sp. MMS21-TC3]